MPKRDDSRGPVPRPWGPDDRDTSVVIESAPIVVDQIFAAGAILESAAELADGPAAARLQHTLDELDALVRDTRTAVFGQLIPPSASSTH